MNIRLRKSRRDRGEAVAADVERVVTAWSTTRAEHGTGGPYLFGAWCLADAFFAPVVTRFVTYDVALDGSAAEYRDAVLAHEPLVEWSRLAETEGHPLPDYDAMT
ncbi:MAG: hypothetical protein AAF533_09820 [Acidobacteriota bacterium]